MTMKIKGFRVTLGKGFQMTFPNGYTASVQWGPNNYCDHHSVWSVSDAETREIGEGGSDTAEVWAWRWTSKGKRKPVGDVRGYVSPVGVLAFLNEVSALPPATRKVSKPKKGERG